MTKDQVITAIDVGSDKCSTLIAKVNEAGELQVVGFSAFPSRGMKRSAIIDLEQVLNTLSQSLDAAERMAGFEVKEAVVSLSGVHIRYKNSKGVVAVASPDQEITQSDVDRVIEAARAVSLPADREIIHVIPKDFKVDAQDGVKDPVGMMGVRLEAEAHIITSLSIALRNLEKCVNDLGLKVNAFVFSALAAAEVALTETERELGVVLVDIGAGTTSIAAFVEGALEFSAVLPLGARLITQDIALGCRIPMDDAEKLKQFLSEEGYNKVQPEVGETKVELARRRRKEDTIDTEQLGIEYQGTISKKTLVNGIMEPRIREIFRMVMDELDKAGLLEENKVPAGLVLTGGGAMTVGLVDVARRVSNMSVRVAVPDMVSGLTEDIRKPSYAVGVGLLEYSKKQGNLSSAASEVSFDVLAPFKMLGRVPAKLKEIVKSVLP